MAKFRTKKNARTTYIYKDAYGRKVMELRPGVDGVTTADIADAHKFDDEVINAQKRDEYHGVWYYEQAELGDRQGYLADTDADPEAMLLTAMEAAERSGKFKAVWSSLTEQQRALVIKKLHSRTNREIAKEENVSEMAIHNRIKKIQKRFEKLFS